MIATEYTVAEWIAALLVSVLLVGLFALWYFRHPR